MNIIESCCAERQLGQLLRENRGHAALFQANGDMTLQKWMKATMLMAGDRPRTLTIAVPVFTEKMMDAVAKFMRLGWIERLRLMTTDPITPEMVQMLADKTECEGAVLAEHIELAADGAIPDGLLMFSGPQGTVVVQGTMPDIITPRLYLYSGVFGRTDGPAVRSITDAWEARFRSRRYEWPVGSNDVAEKPTDGNRTTDSSNTENKKKTRTRKTKKSHDQSNQMVEEPPTTEA